MTPQGVGSAGGRAVRAGAAAVRKAAWRKPRFNDVAKREGAVTSAGLLPPPRTAGAPVPERLPIYGSASPG